MWNILMIKLFRLLLLAALLVLVGCSDDDMTQDNSENEHILSAQVQALEKAKAVESMLQNRVIEQQQVIDEQSN